MRQNVVNLCVLDGREYCQFELFNASCPANQVIVMEDAQYGRLRTGRCVSRDYGYMGCSMSVLHLLDRACSGRRSCEYGIPRLRELVQPCPKDLIAYLEASYSCVAGMLIAFTWMHPAAVLQVILFCLPGASENRPVITG